MRGQAKPGQGHELGNRGDCPTWPPAPSPGWPDSASVKSQDGMLSSFETVGQQCQHSS